MKLDRFIRLAATLLIVAVFVVAIGALLFVTESALNIWDRLQQGPAAILYAYVAVLATLVALAGFLVWRLVVRRAPKAPPPQAAPDISRDDIEQRLREAEQAGIDVAAAQAELAELANRQQSGAVHLCFFGEISKGKSSLLRSLVPEADVEIDVIGGSTDDIRHFRWTSESGNQVLLTDIPGISGLEAGLDEMALAEAQRAQVVLFVCDGDLNRNEVSAVEHLMKLDKPLVLVMNKADRYDVEEQAGLMQRRRATAKRPGGRGIRWRRC